MEVLHQKWRNEMRKLIVTLFALIGMGVSGLAFAGLADGNGIVGSAHDFADEECWDGDYVTPGDNTTPKTYASCAEKTGGWNDSGELCRVCHIPHSHGRSATFMSTGLLWNRDLSTVGTWSPYTSTSLEVPAGTSPDGLSLACLGCHDGLTSISAFDTHAVGNGGTPTAEVIGISGNYAGAAFNAIRYGDGGPAANDITSEHPVSVVYVEGTDAGMELMSATFDGTRTIAQRLGVGDKVQCHSCHDVHNNAVGLNAGGAGQYLLRLPVVDDGSGPSQLCLACHDK